MLIRETQEACHLHGSAEEPVKRRAARILEHEYGPTALVDEIERPNRSGPIQLIPQAIFVSETIKGGGCGMLGSWQHSQYDGPLAIGALAPFPGEDAVAVLP